MVWIGVFSCFDERRRKAVGSYRARVESAGLAEFSVSNSGEWAAALLEGIRGEKMIFIIGEETNWVVVEA